MLNESSCYILDMVIFDEKSNANGLVSLAIKYRSICNHHTVLLDFQISSSKWIVWIYSYWQSIYSSISDNALKWFLFECLFLSSIVTRQNLSSWHEGKILKWRNTTWYVVLEGSIDLRYETRAYIYLSLLRLNTSRTFFRTFLKVSSTYWIP